MAGRTSYYGGIVLDGLIFHIDAAKQESYAKKGLRYMQAGNTSLFIDFADTSKSPSTENATGTIINTATFSNFAPYHLGGYSFYKDYWHNKSEAAWKDSAGIGTFYGNIEFDGIASYANFGLTPEMNGIKDITVSAWFYVNKFGNGLSMIASRYAGGNGWRLYYDNNGVVYFDGSEDLSTYISATSSYFVRESNPSLVPGVGGNGGWYNAVGTKKGNVWSVYVAPTNRTRDVNNQAIINRIPLNNALRGTRTLGTGTVNFTSNFMYLGRGSSTFFMDGRIMQLSVYNRALSLEEININHESYSKRIFEVDGFIPVLNLSWETWTNVTTDANCLETFPGSNIASGWTYSNYNKTIRFNVARSATSGCALPLGTCNLRQLGSATASITVGAVSTYLTLDFVGFGERVASNYDKIVFKLNGVQIAAANAPGDLGTALGKCLDGPVIKTFWDQNGVNPTATGAGVSNPYRYLLLANTSYTLNLYFDTIDALYHYNSYYEALLGFE